MRQWPRPKSLKSLRGFLGLTGYYRRFVKDYGKISHPLTYLLKKDNFHLSVETKEAFEKLKVAMSSAPVLATPHFPKQFVIECDGSGGGIGVVLMQEGRPFAFVSKALSPKNLDLLTYEREMLAVVFVVQKWPPYLLGRHFKICTDHFSLKYLLEQRISTLMQYKWLTKLIGYDFEISYQSRKENKVANALSRQPDESISIMALF